MSSELQKLIDMIRKSEPARISNELVDVQPMDEAGKALGELYKLLKETGGILTITSNKEKNERRND